MHMADALLSPAVGGALWATAAAATVYCSRTVARDADEQRTPLMGVLGAFVFAAQMVNFAIPATGSSGHLGGGLLLAIVLGPHAAFLVMAAVLTVQALVFADGGLLALGCNIVNLALLPCFVAYPLVYRPLVRMWPTARRGAGVFAAVVGLQLGAFAVVLETVGSGISALPLSGFVLLMQPIHLGIGLVEGVVTVAVVGFLCRAQPDLVALDAAPGGRASRRLVVALGAAALVTGAMLSWFASTAPDGLEWSVAEVAGPAAPGAPEGGVHAALSSIQRATALMPGYDFAPPPAAPRWPAIAPATSLAGVLGGTLTLLLVITIGWILRRRAAAV